MQMSPQSFPTIPLISSEMREIWEENLHKGTTQMMEILKDHCDVEIKGVRWTNSKAVFG